MGAALFKRMTTMVTDAYAVIDWQLSEAVCDAWDVEIHDCDAEVMDFVREAIAARKEIARAMAAMHWSLAKAMYKLRDNEAYVVHREARGSTRRRIEESQTFQDILAGK